MGKLLASLASGIVFGIGMAVSGMTSTARVQGFLDFFGSPLGTTMDVSGACTRVVKQQGSASQEGYRGRLKSPQRDQYHAGKTGIASRQ